MDRGKEGRMQGRVKDLRSYVSYSMTPSVQMKRKTAISTEDDPDAQPQAERLRSWQICAHSEKSISS